MRIRAFLAALALISAFAFVGPADAINIGGTEYVLFGKTLVTLEPGAVNIQGNVGVNDVGGQLKIFQFNKISIPAGQQGAGTATATADKMSFGNNAVVDNCEFNTNTGGSSSVCGTISAATVPITTWPPSPVPVIDSCVDSAADLFVPAGPPVTLPPGVPGTGCRKNVNVAAGGTLNLAAGTYNFKSLLMGNGSTLNGNGANVVVKTTATVGPLSEVSKVTITSVAVGTFESISIGNSCQLTDVVLYAPNTRMHLHTGGVYNNFEGIAVVIFVEPVKITTPPPPGVCECPPGTHFEFGEVCPTEPLTCQQSRSCVPND